MAKTYSNTVQMFCPNISTLDTTFYMAPGTNAIKYPVFTLKHGQNSKFEEPLGKKQFTKVQRVGKVHLDPGHIKTDVLIYRKSFLLNTVIKKVLNYSVTDDTALDIGKFGFITVEKMIQAVATDDVKKIRVAYEQDVKYGCVVTAPRKPTSNYFIDQTPL